MFEHLRPYSEDERNRVWSSGLVVLDANILLHLYRVDEKIRTALFAILEDANIASRLWFPHQAVKEFYSNRLNIAIGQLRAIDKLSNQVNEAMASLRDVKDTTRFHINREEWSKLLEAAGGSLTGFLRAAKDAYPSGPTHDPILARLEAIMSGKIGGAPDHTSRTVLQTEGKRRVADKIPPGYEDVQKEENGDYILWEQCLGRCAEQSSSLLLVTDDVKEDWWLRIGSMTVGARPELREEFYSRVPGEQFILVNFETFLERVSGYLSTRVEAGAVVDARDFAHFQRILSAKNASSASVLRPQSSVPADEESNLESASQEEVDFDYEQERSIRAHWKRAPTKKREARRSAENMARWFFERYDDPANGVPYDSGEGGYQYVAGGPYNAADELMNEFDDGTRLMERRISDAVAIIENEGHEWIKKGEY